MSPKDIGQAIWTVEPVDSSEPLFVGWAEAADGENYLHEMMFSTPPTTSKTPSEEPERPTPTPQKESKKEKKQKKKKGKLFKK